MLIDINERERKRCLSGLYDMGRNLKALIDALEAPRNVEMWDERIVMALIPLVLSGGAVRELLDILDDSMDDVPDELKTMLEELSQEGDDGS